MKEPGKVQELGGGYVFVRPDREGLEALIALIEEGSLRVDVAATYPLEQVADAHRALEAGGVPGKIVVTL